MTRASPTYEKFDTLARPVVRSSLCIVVARFSRWRLVAQTQREYVFQALLCPRLQHLKRTRRRNLRGWPASMNRRRTAPACARRAPCGVHGCADDVRLAAITRCRRSTSQSEPGQACGRRQSGDADRPDRIVTFESNRRKSGVRVVRSEGGAFVVTSITCEDR